MISTLGITLRRRIDGLKVSETGKTLNYVGDLKVGNHGIFFQRSPREKHEMLLDSLQADGPCPASCEMPGVKCDV